MSLMTQSESLSGSSGPQTPVVDRTLIAGLAVRAAGVLSAFGERMAAIAVRTRSVEHLRVGLIAMGLAESRLDEPRTNLVVLAAVNHSAVEIGSSLTNVIADVASDLSLEAITAFQSFARLDDRDKSLVVGSNGARRYW